MLRYILLLCILAFIDAKDATNIRVVESVSSSISSESPSKAGFETAHKRTENHEFETAHKITNERPIIKLLEEQVNPEGIMQQQNPQNLLSTKERPELNPVLSALINEDVMKSIESKRAIEQSNDDTKEQPSAPTETVVSQEVATESSINILTTTSEQPRVVDDDVLNQGLVDRSVNLEVAGSESNQKSRIQIKKGPNGVDYEYEYVYYYYDEDDKKENASGKAKPNDQNDATRGDATARGKSRYTNIERSTTLTPENEVSAKGRGRTQQTAAASDVEEGRLPQNTRFPPRSRGGDVTAAPDVAQAAGEKSGRRTGVKRPSLDLIDSDTFNTDEKQVKTNRNIENELNKQALSTEETQDRHGQETDAGSEAQTTFADADVENTTPLMEKAALDLYAIIANENFNLDTTTGDGIDLTTTELPTTSADDLTTIMEEESTTTTTTTTTPEPTTTTTTTTTTPAPLAGGRKGLGGRNRFRLKNGASTTTTTEATPDTGKPSGKAKGRFGGRPSFGSGRTPKPSKEETAVKEEVVKEEAKSSSSSLRGRTRNRFNLRGGSSSSVTEKSTDENTIESKSVSTTARTLRGRPQLNLRGRGRPAATSAPAASETSNGSSDNEKSTPAPASAPRPSRFNLGRPNGNRLLQRGRVNPLKAGGQASTKESTDTTEKKVDEAPVDESVAPPAEEASAASTTDDKPAQDASLAAGGLNRLKSRPKIQVTPKTSKAPSPVVARRPNPLIGRKRIGASTTTEVPAEDGAGSDGNGEADNVAGDSEDPKDEAASVASEQVVEASSEVPARGLGLLANRRRLSLRKPGVVA